MNLYDYIVRKGFEKLSLQSIRCNIVNDMSLNNSQKNALLAVIDTYSKAKDVSDLLTILSNIGK